MLNFFVDIILPPASLAVLALLFVVAGRRGRPGALAALVVLILLGLPVVANGLLNALSPGVTKEEGGAAPGAVVILSADAIRIDGPLDLDPGLLTLDRMRAGAALARRTGLPVLVSGGQFLGSRTSLAAMMSTSLRSDFGVSPRWIEDRSRDTWENAEFSAALLREAGIKTVYLVTHDWHMRRSMIAFRHFGLDPVPAPVRPPYSAPLSWRSFVISPTAWFNSYIALHEWVGLAYYTLRR